MKNLKTLVALVAIAVACPVIFAAFKHASRTNNLSDQLIGEWRNVYMKITIHHKTDAPITMEADSTNWEERLHIKPIRTHFMEDGTFYSEYINLKDSLVRKPSGIWSIKGDSLTMTRQIPDKSTYKLRLSIVNNRATFSGKIDFDGEGINNDEYFGIQKKFVQ